MLGTSIVDDRIVLGGKTVPLVYRLNERIIPVLVRGTTGG